MGSAGVLLPSDPKIGVPCPEAAEPARLEQNTTFGYHLVAGRAIRAGEEIVNESPLMLCPSSDLLGPGSWACLTCYRPCSTSCSSCGWPVCAGGICEKGVLHTENECGILSKHGVRLTTPAHDYTAIKVLRCLLLRERAPWDWALLLKHDAQLLNRSADIKTKEATDHVINFILEECQFRPAFDPQTIHLILGILATNEFSLTLNDYTRHVFLFLHKPAYFTHSCCPNMQIIWQFNPTTDSSYAPAYFSLKFFANRDISAGELLTHSYLPEMDSVERRQVFLYSHYYFKCDCERCRTELFREIPGSPDEEERDE